MNFASKQCYIKKIPTKKTYPPGSIKIVQNEQKKQEQKVISKSQDIPNNMSDEEIEVDTNVFEIGFNFLQNDKENIALGDPVVCTKCSAFLNKYSKIMKAADYLNLNEDKKQKEIIENKIEKNEKIEVEPEIIKETEKSQIILVGHVDNEIKDLGENDQIWICEFCLNHNKIRIEPEEIPTKEDVIYILPGQTDLSKVSENKNSDISLIFCIDFSGSMSATTQVQGSLNLKHGLTNEEMEMLKQFIEPGAQNQWYPGQKSNTTFISRQQCVVAAIQTQIQELKASHPNRNIGLVLFNDEVVVIGDGTKDPIFIAGDRLNKYDEIMALSTGSAEIVQKATVKDSAELLISKLQKMQEKGQTALGPGLLAGLGLASKGKPGSMVILCTDGLANVGLGVLDGSQDPKENFYDKAAEFAKEKGIVISIVTIKGEGCQIETLNKLVDETNGNVTRVSPENIGKDFAAVLKDEVIATKVKLTVRLNKLLNFRNEDPSCLLQNGSVYIKDLGNATTNTKLAFEYTSKSVDELNAMGIKDIQNLKEVPFQSQIEYTSLEGQRFLRVLTNFQVATDIKEDAQEDVDARIIHKRVAQVSNAVMFNGDYKKANVMNQKWNNYLISNQKINENVSNYEANNEFLQENAMWRKAAGKKEKRSKAMPISSSIKLEQEEEGFFDKIKNVFKGESQSSSLSSNSSSLSSNNKFSQDGMISKKSKPVTNLQSKIQVTSNFSDHDSFSSDEDQEEAVFQQKKKK